MTDYDYGDHDRIDRILAMVAAGWRTYPQFRLGQFLEVVAATHHLGTIPDQELERRLADPSTWEGPPPAVTSSYLVKPSKIETDRPAG